MNEVSQFVVALPSIASTRERTVRVKDGISLRNGMWHGLRNDIIMRNLIYAAE